MSAQGREVGGGTVPQGGYHHGLLWGFGAPDWLRTPLETQQRPGPARSGSHLASFCLSYAGHGAGARFLDGQAVLRLSCRAVALLFGCSSAALAVHGNLEGAGIVLKYIMAGW